MGNAFYYYDSLGQKKRARNVKLIANENTSIFSSNSDTKVFKLGIEPSNWKDIDFDDTSWFNAKIYYDPAWLGIPNANTIWHPTTNVFETCLFRHTFITASASKAFITFNHDNDLNGLYINGELIVSQEYGSDYSPYWKNQYVLDVTKYLIDGKNVIAIKATNFTSVAMIQFSLAVDLNKKGKLKYKNSDNSWRGINI